MNENYTSGIQRLLKISKEESLKIGHSYVGSEHLLLAIIKDSKGSASNTLIAVGCNLDKMKNLLKESLTASNVTSTLGHLPLTRRAERILKNSFIEAKNDNRKSSGQNDLLLSMLLEKDCTLHKIFNLCSIDYQIIKSYVTSSNNIKIIHKKKYTDTEKESTLKMFSRNISDIAAKGELDPVIGRNSEIERLSQILSRRKKIIQY